MDTADFRRLVEAFDPEKAMAIAQAIERNTITPPAFEAALARLESRIESRFDKLEGKMDSAIARLDAKIDTSVATLRGEIANTRTEIATSRGEILKWMAGVAIGWVVAVAGVAFAIVRLGTP
jgi:hypothetical protein